MKTAGDISLEHIQKEFHDHREVGDLAEHLRLAILDHTAKLAVVGLGYVGLPLAVEFANVGFLVSGLDLDQTRCRQLSAGESYIGDISANVVQALVREDKLRPTSDYQCIATSEVVLMCLPTPTHKNREPDLRYVTEGAQAMVPFLRPGQLVVLESTTYPGTTEEVLAPILAGSGLTPGQDLFLAYSPERIDPGNPRYGVRNTPRVVGGINPLSTELACTLYAQVVEQVIPVSSPREAEMAKLIENTFRHVNIALVNELAMLCDRMKINIWEAIEAAATKPFGFMPFRPGPGVGGHCIPIDPCYLSWKAREYDAPARFIELATEVNASMPEYVVGKVVDALNSRGKAVQGARVLVLGVAYKRDIADTRESPAIKIIDRLRGKGAKVSYHDPHVPELVVTSTMLRSVPLDVETLTSADCVVLATDHRAYPLDLIARHSRLLVDTRHVFAERNDEHIVKLWDGA